MSAGSCARIEKRSGGIRGRSALIVVSGGATAEISGRTCGIIVETAVTGHHHRNCAPTAARSDRTGANCIETRVSFTPTGATVAPMLVITGEIGITPGGIETGSPLSFQLEWFQVKC
jgi:hypothetical protein